MNNNHKLTDQKNQENQNPVNPVPEEKKENFFKRVWDKIPGWAKTTAKVAGVAAVGIGAYTLGRGRSDDFDDEPYIVYDQPDNEEKTE